MHQEHLTLAISDEAEEILVHAGWTTYFTRFQPPNEEIAIEFLQHLQNGKSLVRSKKITVTDVVIEKVSGLLAEGPIWVGKRLKLHDVMEVFRDEG